MKVSYHKRFGPKGTVYNQAVSLKRSELEHLNMAIYAERDSGFPRVKEYCPEGKNHAEVFLKRIKPAEYTTNFAYLNLTQRRFMELFLLKDTKAKMKDRNTCLLIK